jgi:transcriptional regulator with XRE-family HTH domain
MTPTELLQRLVDARKAAGLTQRELGRLLGVTQTAVSYWEGGGRDMGLSTAAEYAKAVGMTLIVWPDL